MMRAHAHAHAFLSRSITAIRTRPLLSLSSSLITSGLLYTYRGTTPIASIIPTCQCSPAQPHSGTFSTVTTPSKETSRTIAGTDVVVETPDDALRILRGGNQRFVNGDVMGEGRSMTRVRAVSSFQKPFASILACADSRVPVELIFDQGFGDLFVNRVAGNIVTTELCASLEFGSLVLGTKVIYVLGHTGCGAVNATLAAAPVPGVISSLYYHMHAACHSPTVTQLPAESTERAAMAVQENVKFQVRQLRVSPVLSELVKEEKIKIVGGVYDLATGKVTELDVA